MTQDQALAILKTGANVFLTGEPGSGKSHTVNRYAAFLRERNIAPAVTASTGIAATHVGGVTLHSWSGIDIRDELTAYDLIKIGANGKVAKRVRKAGVLIIDEVSMLDARTFDMVDEVCRALRDDQRPFGGMQVVMVGDFFQLPPVGRQGRKAAFAFHSPAWTALAPVVCYLTEQHRQEDPRYLAILAAIRAGTLGEDHLQALEEREARRHKVPPDLLKLFSHNFDVDRLNDRKLSEIPGEARTFTMTEIGAERDVASLKRGCLSPEELKLKIGAAVMCTRNNSQAGFVNGTLATVIGWDDFGAGHPIIETYGGKRLTIEPANWNIEEQDKVRASIQQVPLRLAWAITVHKSQGMSLDGALMDLGGVFEYGQGYVALSRVRSLAGVYLAGCNERALRVHPEMQSQDQAFRSASDAAAESFEAGTPAERQALEEAFILRSGGAQGGGSGKAFDVSEIRVKHAKAYRRWTKEEERDLEAYFRAGTPIAVIAEKLERQKSGITARLEKLGLYATVQAKDPNTL